MRKYSCIAAMLLLATVAALGAQTLTVPDDYPTIQAAIDAAEPGDTVFVRAGTYTENVTVDKEIRLLGSGRGEVRIGEEDPERPVMFIPLDAGELSIEAITIFGGKRGVDVRSTRGTSVRLIDLLVVENEQGLVVAGKGAVSVERCLFVDNELGVVLDGGRARLHESEICLGTVGVLLVGEANLTMSRCLVGLANYAIDTHTRDCGWAEGSPGFSGSVAGEGNRVFGISSALCPSYPGAPWPEGFTDVGWREAVEESLAAHIRGVQAYRVQDYSGALHWYGKAFALLEEEEVGFDLLEGYLLQDIGVAYLRLGRYEEALEAYEAAQAVYVERGMAVKVAEVDMGFGFGYSRLGRYEEALEAYETARAAYTQRGMQVKIAELDQNIGIVYRDLGRYEEALRAYRSAQAVYAEHALDVAVAELDSSIGIVYAERGQYDDALEMFRSARAVFAARGLKAKVAEVDTNIAIVYRRLGWYKEALDLYEAARAVFADRGPEVKVAEVDQNIGVVYRELGRYEEALEVYEAARAAYADRGLEVKVAGVDQSIGIVYESLGWYDDALEVFRSARAVFAARGLEVKVAEVDTNIGIVYEALGQYEEALEAFRSSREVFVGRGLKVVVAKVDTNTGVVYQSLGLYEDALKVYEAARAAYHERGLEIKVAEVDQNIGVVYKALGRYEEALAAYNSALDILDAIPPLPSMPYSHPTIRWTIYGNRGLAYEALDRFDEAVTAYEKAINVVESIREHFQAEELKLAWGERTSHVYERLIDLLHRMERGAEAFPYAERSRARTFLDTLYGGGVQPEQLISAEAGVSAGVVDPQAIDEAVEETLGYLEPEEAVLSYFVTDRGVYLWVMAWDEGAGSHTIGKPLFIPYPREELLADVIACRQEFEPRAEENGNGEPGFGEPETLLGRLYEELVKPGLALLPDGVDTLVFVPSGPLWYLPFAALVMTDHEPVQGGPVWAEQHRPRYLVDEYTLGYLPSVASLAMLAGLERNEVGRGVYVGLANPVLSPEQVEELGLGEGYRYPGLERAATEFAQQLVGEEEPYTVYLGDEATEIRAHEEAPGHRVVVYAAHGQFNPFAPLMSQLFLAPGDAEKAKDDRRIPDGHYRAWEALLTDHRGTELVVLAACETLLPSFWNLKTEVAGVLGVEAEDVDLTPEQLEPITSGDEVVGFARAFLSAGAQRVLGSQWVATAGGVEQLLPAIGAYRTQGLTWAQALRQAQLGLLSDPLRPALADPFFWAPFQLIGRWR